MPTLPESRITHLLGPYRPVLPPGLAGQLGLYLDLLLRWNARTNLSAIREPEEIVRRHFGEGLFTAAQLETRLPPNATVLDFGSGGGFPGLPIQLLLPDLQVTLAESQGKKAAFLREAVRALGLRTEVWAGRVEDMPAGRMFDCVTLRAVDRMGDALNVARQRVAVGGFLAALGGESVGLSLPDASRVDVPESKNSYLFLLESQS